MNSCCASSSSLPGAAPAASSSTLNARPPTLEKRPAPVFAIIFLICGFNKAGLCCYRSRRDPEPKELRAALQPDGRWWQIVAQHSFQPADITQNILLLQLNGPNCCKHSEEGLWAWDRSSGSDWTAEEAGTTSWFWCLIFSVYRSAWESWIYLIEHLQPSLRQSEPGPLYKSGRLQKCWCRHQMCLFVETKAGCFTPGWASSSLVYAAKTDKGSFWRRPDQEDTFHWEPCCAEQYRLVFRSSTVCLWIRNLRTAARHSKTGFGEFVSRRTVSCDWENIYLMFLWVPDSKDQRLFSSCTSFKL